MTPKQKKIQSTVDKITTVSLVAGSIAGTVAFAPDKIDMAIAQNNAASPSNGITPKQPPLFKTTISAIAQSKEEELMSAGSQAELDRQRVKAAEKIRKQRSISDNVSNSR